MNIKIILSLLIMGSLHLLFSLDELKTVNHVDLNRYLGKWYEIGRYPNPFQKDCYLSTATYSLDDNGDIIVLNECKKGSAKGKYKSIKGKAKIVDRKSNSKLKVSFFWPFYGKYWIVALDDDYSYAVVSEPKRKYLWILSRTATIDPAKENEIYQKLTALGFDPKQLIKQ